MESVDENGPRTPIDAPNRGAGAIPEREEAPVLAPPADSATVDPAETNIEEDATSGGVPPEYTGIRDANLVRLYSVFKRSLEYQSKKLAASQAGDAVSVNYFEAAAYVELIQSQRLFYYGYASPPPTPANTNDEEYHLTGSGGMIIVFRLSRTEFPDLFAAKDRQREMLQAKQRQR